MPQWQQGSLAHIYVIVEDYLNHGYEKKKGYAKYEGAQYSALLNRQREQPFGAKLQNHAFHSQILLQGCSQAHCVGIRW